MGCSDCKTGAGGCESHKGPQRLAIDNTLATVYPTRRWGEPDDAARFGAGVTQAEARRIARALSTATRAPTWHRPGADDDLCETVWILCMGREPALVEQLESGECDTGRIEERYLRVSLSTVARLACVQEVVMKTTEDGVVEIAPRAGVYDGTLLKRMRATVALLEGHRLEHLDFGLVAKPWSDGDGSAYVERYGVEPQIVNYLFYAAPATAASTVWLPVRAVNEPAEETEQEQTARF
jgi:hypothetical protein